MLLSITFLLGWAVFPLTFVFGHSGMDRITAETQIGLFVACEPVLKRPLAPPTTAVCGPAMVAARAS